MRCGMTPVITQGTGYYQHNQSLCPVYLQGKDDGNFNSQSERLE